MTSITQPTNGQEEEIPLDRPEEAIPKIEEKKKPAYHEEDDGWSVLLGEMGPFVTDSRNESTTS